MAERQLRVLLSDKEIDGLIEAVGFLDVLDITNEFAESGHAPHVKSALSKLQDAQNLAMHLARI